MKKTITEDHVEQAALAMLQEDLGYDYVYGPDISPDGKNPERNDYGEAVLVKRLKRAIDGINPKIPEQAKEATAILKENAPFLRSIVASKIRARRVPELRFVYDASLERGANLESLISKARDSDPGFEEE